MSLTLKVSQVSLAEHGEPHRRLRAIHGSAGRGEWQHTQEQAIDYLENCLFNYYLLQDARAIRLTVGQTAAGEKFLKTEKDDHVSALLLQLPVIPAVPN